jgi:2-keto-3-deoxy-L-rhamnonate aldolase RhmA
VVRLSRGDEVSIKRALDAGAAGIIVPQVNSAAQARLVVSYAKFPPDGSRGVGLSRASMYGLEFDSYLARANEESAVIVQAEHIDAVDNIDEICAVAGVDAVFVGPYDLSGSLNRLGRVHEPEVVAAVERVRDACRRHRMIAGIHGGTPEQVAARVAEGYGLLSCSTDIGALASGVNPWIPACARPCSSSIARRSPMRTSRCASSIAPSSRSIRVARWSASPAPCAAAKTSWP